MGVTMAAKKKTKKRAGKKKRAKRRAGKKRMRQQPLPFAKAKPLVIVLT